jgi:hypothetical protein
MEVTVKIRTTIAAAAAAVALGTTGALVLPAVASAHGATHTLKFVSVLKKLVVYNKTTVAEQDTDVNGAGKATGFDELYATQTGKTTGMADVTFAENGGLLYGALTLTHNGARAHGTVTGGTGAFKGATGTITVKPANSSGTHSAVTITYTS